MNIALGWQKMEEDVRLALVCLCGVGVESTSMVWPTLGSRTAKEQNRTGKMSIKTYSRRYSFLSISDMSAIPAVGAAATLY